MNDASEFSAGLIHAVAVVGVNDEDQALGARKVVSPERTDLVLTADIPNIKLGVLVSDSLDVEADGGDRRHVLVQFEFVQNGWERMVRKSRKGQRCACHSLVLPAASRPSINNRISFEPKILAIILDIEPPIVNAYVPVARNWRKNRTRAQIDRVRGFAGRQ